MKRTLLALTLALTMMVPVSVFAEVEQHPEKNTHGTTNKAYVSKELDTATREDNTMGTQFYVFIPEEHNDAPNMGVEGMNLNYLTLITMGVGMSYLMVHHYAKQN